MMIIFEIFTKYYAAVAVSFQYFIVDESSGRLLVQGKDQKDASEFANLLLSNVKTCDDLEVDRNFCFQVSVKVCYTCDVTCACRLLMDVSE